MRIVTTGDIHLDEHNRFNETVTLLEWMRADFETWKPALVVVAGDSAPVSVRSMTPKERVTLADWYISLAEFAPVVVITGNHDVSPNDVALFSRLQSRFPIYAKQEPDVIQVGSDYMVAVLPWPSKAYLTSLVPDNNLETLDDLCRKALAGIMRGFRLRFEQSPGIRLLVSHLNVRGAVAGGFRLVGQDVECDVDTLESSGADAVILSHLHMHQRFNDRIWFSGSPRRVDHGEEDEIKGYVRATVERDQKPIIEFRPTPLRKMETIELDLGDPFCMDGKRFTAGSQARLVIRMAEEDIPSLDLPRILAQLGAEAHSDLKIDKQITPKTRMRSEAIQEARTDGARLEVYLRQLDPKPESATIDRVKGKLDSLTASAV